MINRKFSIIQKIDINELDNMISKYTCLTGETDPYLFMNKNTIDAIPTADDLLSNHRKTTAIVNGIVGCYCGYKVFRDDTLDFGEVEIR